MSKTPKNPEPPTADPIGEWDDFLGTGDIIADMKKQEAEEAAQREAAEKARAEAEEARKKADEARQADQAARDAARDAERLRRRGGDAAKPDEAKKPEKFLTFDDVIGLKDVKREITQAVVRPITHPHVYERYDMPITKGILLTGPPGQGKTLIGKATAHQIAEKSGKPFTPECFSYHSCTSFLNSLWGATEQNIRRIFQEAKAFKQKHGYRQVIFLDEPDAVFKSRGGNGANTFMDGPVNTMLTELDGIGELAAFVILATNRPDQLDSALLRPGRIDRKIHVGRPTREDSEAMFELYLKKTCCEDPFRVALDASDALWSGDYVFSSILFSGGEAADFGLREIRSGALIANIVNRAIGAAIDRDIEADKNDGFVTSTDILDAVEAEFGDAKILDHKDAITEFANGRVIDSLVKRR